MGIYFILWFIIQYFFINFLFDQIILALATGSHSLYPINKFLSVEFGSTSLLFWHYKKLQDHLVYFFLSPQTVHISKGAWVPGVLTGKCHCLGAGSWQSQEIHSCVYRPIYGLSFNQIK